MFVNDEGVSVCEQVVDVTTHDNPELPCVSGFLYSFRVCCKEQDTSVVVVHPEKLGRTQLNMVFNEVLYNLERDGRYPLVDEPMLVAELRKFGFSNNIYGISWCNVATVNKVEKMDMVGHENNKGSDVQTTLI